MVRAMLLAALAAISPVTSGLPLAAPSTAVPAARWQWPLEPDPAVVRSFHAPPTPWSAGHRGVDLAAAPGTPVRAAGAGRVTFSGLVAGRGVVVVMHPDGLRTSYEPVDHRAAAGTVVQAGDVLGRLAGAGGHCAPAACLHWGLRRGEVYLDPLALVGRAPPVLLPLG